MCDTFVALADATRDGRVIFGKNSDRPGGEIQDVETIPASMQAEGELVQCSYIAIPQVAATYAVILSKPRWMWGAEMGANEHGVVIGNEAVWTTQPYRHIGLLGMDLVRLGLERGETAYSALKIIVELLAQQGQGGNCAEHFAMNYHNSFLIADSREAWVLETAGSYWVAEKVTNGTRSISNNLSIRNQGDWRHPDVIDDAVARGLCRDANDFDFAKFYSAVGVDDGLSPYSREGHVRQLCRLNESKFTLETAQAILCDHQAGVCMHGEFETRGSQISVLSPQGCQHWFIEQPFPCQVDYRVKAFE